MCSRTLVIVTSCVVLGMLAAPQRARGQHTYLVYDTFTDPYDVRNLQNHPPDVRPSDTHWRWLNGEGRTLVMDGVVKNVEGTTREAWTYYSQLTDAIVAVDFTSGSGNPHGGLVFRNVSPNQYFLLDANGPTLYRNDNGYMQSLGSGGRTVRAGERHRLEVHFAGAAIDVYFDYAFLFRVSDWTYADGVQHGFFFDAPSDPNAVFDNFEVSYVNGGPSPCEYTVSPLGKNLTADSFSGSVTVSAQPGCVWNTWSEADFIYVVDSGGSGSGTVRYKVENSTRTESRSGTFTVADHTITITQSGVAPPPPPPSSAPPSAAPSAPPPLPGLGAIVWGGNVADSGSVNRCWGNCGADCSNRPNPCGGPSYWSNEWLSLPQYVDDNYAISTCLGPAVITDVYRHYVVTGRWTYHGRSSDGCRLHDNICRALGNSPVGFFGCFIAAVLPGSAYCAGARDENWSYTYVLNGHSADPVETFFSAQPCDSGF